MVGSHILYHWPVVGWCHGIIQRCDTDRRRKVDGEPVNFYVYYDCDDEEASHALSLQNYGGEDEGDWVLLQEVQ